MKKLLIALLALSVAGTVFAADPALTFSGALKTGLTMTSDDSDVDYGFDGDGEALNTGDGKVSLYSDDAEKALRLELVGAYTDGDFGVKFRLRADGQAALNFSYGYAWGNLFNKMVTFKVGYVDDGAWATEGDEGFDVADKNGLQIQVKPMAGLNVGVKLNAPAIVGVAAPAPRAMTYSEFFSESALGLGYTSDLFNFQAGYQMDSAYDDAATADYDSNAYTFAYVGASYKGMKGLTAIAEAKLNNLGASSDIGWTWVNEVFGYDVNEQINVGLISHQKMYNYDDAAGDAIPMYYSVQPKVAYKLNDKTTLGFAVQYAAQDEMTETWVKPSVTVQFAPKAKFVGFFKYNTYTADADTDAVNTQTIQLDFIYSF